MLDNSGGDGVLEKSLDAGSLFTYLAPAERDSLIRLGERRTFTGNQLLMRQGDPTDHVLLLISGWVRVYSTSRTGQHLLLALRGPGDVLGDLAALHGWGRTATVETISDVGLVQIRNARFMECLHTQPQIAIAMLKQMSVRLREADSARADAATVDVTQRVARYLLQLIERHGAPNDSGIELRMPLTQQDIADRVGASRRAVARGMSVLRERGIVLTAGRRITVVTPEVLRLFARPEDTGPSR